LKSNRISVSYDVGFSDKELNTADGFAEDCFKPSAGGEDDLQNRQKKNKNYDIP
jgi:hypothetical protein